MSIRITSVKKVDGNYENPHLSISLLGWLEDGLNDTGNTTRENMHDWILNGGSAYMIDSTGSIVYLVAATSDTGTKYVHSNVTEPTADELLRLQECTI